MGFAGKGIKYVCLMSHNRLNILKKVKCGVFGRDKIDKSGINVKLSSELELVF